MRVDLRSQISGEGNMKAGDILNFILELPDDAVLKVYQYDDQRERAGGGWTLEARWVNER